MAGGVIAAAIITSIVAAGATSATIITSELKSSGSWVGGVVVNESDFSFQISSYKANHGNWMTHPHARLSSVKDIIELLRQEAETANNDGNPVSDSQLLQYYRDHYVKLDVDQPFVKSATTTWEMAGANMGSEGLVRLRPEGISSWDIYLLTRKLPGGSYGAGISIITRAWVKTKKFTLSDDSEGSDFCEHIRESSNTGPSSYFSEGSSLVEANGPIKIAFAGAQTSKFILMNNT